MYLLQRQDHALLFPAAKRYDVGTGYIALYDEKEHICCLCRLLDPQELQTVQMQKHSCRICDLDDERPVKPMTAIVLLGQLDTLENADRKVESYRVGLEALEQFRS